MNQGMGKGLRLYAGPCPITQLHTSTVKVDSVRDTGR